jgi:hypothetical protein
MTGGISHELLNTSCFSATHIDIVFILIQPLRIVSQKIVHKRLNWYRNLRKLYEIAKLFYESLLVLFAGSVFKDHLFSLSLFLFSIFRLKSFF